MATYVPPKKNTAYILYVSLVDQSNTKLFKSNPTLAAGDFKVSIDGGTLNNLTTLPTVTPASGKMVKISLSTSEMNGDNITIVCSDAAGAEWCDLTINLQTAARQIDDLAYPATSGRSMVVDAAGLVDANTVKIGPTGAGTAQTARDIGTSVLLSSGTGTGQLDFTAGVVKANATQWLGGTIPAVNVTGVPKVDVFDWLGTGAPANTGDAFARLGAPAGASVSADVAAVKGVLPAALVSGRIDASVGAMAANTMTAAAAAADLTTELQAGLATSAALATLQTTANAIDAKTTNLPSDPADESLIIAATDAIMASVATVDGVVDAIKAKTDSLAFTVAGQIDANIRAVNSLAVDGDGSDSNPWGPA